MSAVPPQCPAPIYLVNRPGAATTSVAFGELGVSVKDKDATALDVANMMLNSFGGRLFTEVRSKRGLSYSVQGRWLMEATYDGVFVVAADTDRPAELITRVRVWKPPGHRAPCASHPHRAVTCSWGVHGVQIAVACEDPLVV